MAILRVARLGHPVLRQRASDIEVADIKAGKFRSLIEDMFETMHEYEGVGLAGPQVHLPLRIFVFTVDDDVSRKRKVPPLQPGAFFNASYEILGEERVTDWEGCLSIPFLSAETPRARKIVLRGINEIGEAEEKEVSGYSARIFQHEIDHTDGHVYLDRLDDLTTLSYTMIL